MDNESKQWPTPSDILRAAKEVCEDEDASDLEVTSPRDAIRYAGPKLYADVDRAELRRRGVGDGIPVVYYDKARPATAKALGFWQQAFLAIFDKAIALAEKEEKE